MRLNRLQKTAVTALEDIKARDITLLDVRKLTSLYDTLIIATAESNRQVNALAQHVRDGDVRVPLPCGVAQHQALGAGVGVEVAVAEIEIADAGDLVGPRLLVDGELKVRKMR